MSKTKGTIRKIINKTENGKPKAFGFIRMTDGEDVFFIPSNMDISQGIAWEELKEGEAVECNVIDHPKGLRAVDVRILR